MDGQIQFGCVADDFTGASDAASFLAEGGANVVLFNGVPDTAAEVPDGVQAAVVALKTRTQETRSAAADSMEALEWLLKRGAGQFYMKYCSTFDSTPRGNIGPICDAALDRLNAPFSLLCPSLPVNGRTVEGGRLYVNGLPLEKTHMGRHPLTPMWDSYIPELMREQSQYPCHVLDRETMLSGMPAVENLLSRYREKGERFYLVPDFSAREDAKTIVSLFGDLPLLTGGSGLLEELARRFRPAERSSRRTAGVAGKAILLAGSCSVATQSQVKYFLQHIGKGIMLEPDKLLSGAESADAVWDQIGETEPEKILIYSAGSGGAAIGDKDGGAGAEALELAMAQIARLAVCGGYTRIIAAGGETSGAVTKALNFFAYEIGPAIAPGVPVMIPLSDAGVRLVLKSGNFGREDFFARALSVTEGEKA